MTVTATVTVKPLDPESLDRRLCGVFASAALVAAVTGRGPVYLGSVENDKRKQARVVRELVNEGWLRLAETAHGQQHQITDAAIRALAVEPTTPLMAARDHYAGIAIADPYAYVLSHGMGPSDKAEVRAMLWRVLNPQNYRWALVPTDRSRYSGYGRFPIPLDSSRPLAPQVAVIRDAWRAFTGTVSIDGLDLVVSDDALVLRHQQERALALWKQHRGRTMLALARFGGYAKAGAKAEAEADEADVDEIPSLSHGVPFIRPRTSEGYDPARSWEDEAQDQIAGAMAAIRQAQARHAALLDRYARVSLANPVKRPYDAMRFKYEQWLAEQIVAETGVDPRMLPESDDR
jgi:hypothetical protein